MYLKKSLSSANNPYKNFMNEFLEKRKQLFHQIIDVKQICQKLPEFSSVQNPENYKLLYNILFVVLANNLSLIEINGDLKHFLDDYFSIFSYFCFDIFSVNSQFCIQSMEELNSLFLNKIDKLVSTQQVQKKIIDYSIEENKFVFKSKFLICESLFILYESVIFSKSHNTHINQNKK